MIPPALRLTLKAGGLPKTAVDFLRGMAGREVRGTVMQEAPPGALATLRIGGHLLSARVESGLLHRGASVFFRVERRGEHGFRLVLLPGAEKLAASGSMPQGVLETLSRFLAEQPTTGRQARAVERERFRQLVASLGQGADPEAPTLLAVAWEEAQSGGDSQGGEGTAREEQRNRRDDSPDEQQESTALARLEPAAKQLGIRVDFPETGVVAVVFVWADGEPGERVFVRCERPQTARWIQADADGWRAALNAAGLLLTEFHVLGPEGFSGVEFRA